MALYPTVIHATSSVKATAAMKIPGPNLILNTKFSSHLFMPNQAIGAAIKNATTMSMTNSFEKRNTILEVDAPNTFLTPTSLVFCKTMKENQAIQTQAGDDDGQNGKHFIQLGQLFFLTVEISDILVQK
jgi:hypothetical protein